MVSTDNVTHTTKVTVQDLNIMVNYLKDLQFVIILVNAHTEVQTCIPTIPQMLYANASENVTLLKKYDRNKAAIK